MTLKIIRQTDIETLSVFIEVKENRIQIGLKFKNQQSPFVTHLVVLTFEELETIYQWCEGQRAKEKVE